MSSPETEYKPPTGIRWWPAIFIVSIIGVIAWFFYLRFVRLEDETFKNFSIIGASVVATFLLSIWWMLFSRKRWGAPPGFFGWILALIIRAVILVIVLASLGLAVHYSVRIDGFTGDNIPVFSFRWEERKVEPQEVSASTATNVVAATTIELDDTDSPGFRGAERDGIVRGIQFNDTWLQPKELWRIPVGKGWSSFATAGPYIWTQEQDGEKELVTCYDAATGARVWTHEDNARFTEFWGGAGPRSTPEYHDGKIYALGATGILNCLDAVTGKSVWSANILKQNQAKNIPWAMAGSPLVLGDRVYVSPGGKNGALVAYHRLSGEKIGGAGTNITSYSSPHLFKLHGQEQILIHHGYGISGHDPVNLKENWTASWTTGTKINVAQPLVYGGTNVFLSLGYGKGSVMFDVLREGEDWMAEERWRSPRLKSKFNNFVQDGQYVYGLDEGRLVCLDLDTGNRTWRGDKFGFGQLLRIGKTLLVLSEKGEVVYVKADPDEFAIIGRFQAISGKTWNHPAIGRGRLFVRNGAQAACYELQSAAN